MALFLDVGFDDILRVGSTTIVIERKSGRKVRMRISGTDEIEMTKKPDAPVAPAEKAPNDGPDS